MSFRKFQSVEKTDVVSPEDHQRISKEMHRVGKTSMRELDENERQQVTEALDNNGA